MAPRIAAPKTLSSLSVTFLAGSSVICRASPTSETASSRCSVRSQAMPYAALRLTSRSCKCPQISSSSALLSRVSMPASFGCGMIPRRRDWRRGATNASSQVGAPYCTDTSTEKARKIGVKPHNRVLFSVRLDFFMTKEMECH
jgi:hypothetical protein